MIALDPNAVSDTPISDYLQLLCQCLRLLEGDTKPLGRSEVEAIRACIQDVRPAVLRLERELLRLDWTAEGRGRRSLAERLAAELDRPDTNVVPLHPGFAEVSPFGDDLDGGAA